MKDSERLEIYTKKGWWPSSGRGRKNTRKAYSINVELWKSTGKHPYSHDMEAYMRKHPEGK